jgi:hypothetical protein
VFAPSNDQDDTPHVPPEEAKFEGSRDFRIEIKYAYERQTLAFKGTMRQGFDGRLYWESEGGGGSF